MCNSSYSQLYTLSILFIQTHRRRSYEVKSMTSTTYQLSRKYLARFFFRRILEDVLDADPNAPNVHARGLTYFLDRIVARLNEPIEDSADPAYEELDDEYVERGVVVGLLGRPRRLQAKTSAEVEEHFARHGRWLLRHEHAVRMTKNRLFNLALWQAGLRRLHQRSTASPDDSSGSDVEIRIGSHRWQKTRVISAVPHFTKMTCYSTEYSVMCSPYRLITSTAYNPISTTTPTSPYPPVRLILPLRPMPTRGHHMTPNCSSSSHDGVRTMRHRRHGRTIGSGTARNMGARTQSILSHSRASSARFFGRRTGRASDI